MRPRWCAPPLPPPGEASCRATRGQSASPSHTAHAVRAIADRVPAVCVCRISVQIVTAEVTQGAKGLLPPKLCNLVQHSPARAVRAVGAAAPAHVCKHSTAGKGGRGVRAGCGRARRRLHGEPHPVSPRFAAMRSSGPCSAFRMRTAARKRTNWPRLTRSLRCPRRDTRVRSASAAHKGDTRALTRTLAADRCDPTPWRPTARTGPRSTANPPAARDTGPSARRFPAKSGNHEEGHRWLDRAWSFRRQRRVPGRAAAPAHPMPCPRRQPCPPRTAPPPRPPHGGLDSVPTAQSRSFAAGEVGAREPDWFRLISRALSGAVLPLPPEFYSEVSETSA